MAKLFNGAQLITRILFFKGVHVFFLPEDQFPQICDFFLIFLDDLIALFIGLADKLALHQDLAQMLGVADGQSLQFGLQSAIVLVDLLELPQKVAFVFFNKELVYFSEGEQLSLQFFNCLTQGAIFAHDVVDLQLIWRMAQCGSLHSDYCFYPIFKLSIQNALITSAWSLRRGWPRPRS